MDGTIVVCATDGEVKRSLRTPGGMGACGVSGVAWSALCPDLLASSSESGTIYLWDTAKAEPECLVATLSGHKCVCGCRAYVFVWGGGVPSPTD